MGLLFLAFILGIIAVTLLVASLSIAPWVPTRGKDLKRIFDLAQLQKGETFYDIGSGSGTLIFGAARHTQAHPIGIELSLPMYLVSQIRKLFSRHKHVQFLFKNAHKVDLSKADVVYIFGLPGHFDQLIQKFQTELQPGARVLSYTFPLEGLEYAVKDKPSEKDLPIYVYRF